MVRLIFCERGSFSRFYFLILGETYSVEDGWKGMNSFIPLEDYVKEWIVLGAKFIGGCCRTDAKAIRRIKEKVEQLQLLLID